MNALCDLVRGAGGAAFDVVGKGKKGKAKEKEKLGIDLDEICGGKVNLSKDVRFILNNHRKRK